MKTVGLLMLSAFSLAAGACATTATAPDSAPRAQGKKTPAAPAFLAADLQAMSIAELDAALGAPALTRVEGAGEFRRYTLAECALMIILYPDEKGERRVARLDAGALVSGVAPPDLGQCLAVGVAE